MTKLDYLHKLETEYFEAEIRMKIHHSPKNKRFWSKVMGYKKEKILSISNEIDVDCIFTDIDTHKNTKKLVYPDDVNRNPKMFLSDEEMILYYSLGSDVKVFTENDTFLGKIVSFNPDKKILSVKKRGSDTIVLVLLNNARKIF